MATTSHSSLGSPSSPTLEPATLMLGDMRLGTMHSDIFPLRVSSHVPNVRSYLQHPCPSSICIRLSPGRGKLSFIQSCMKLSLMRISVGSAGKQV